MEKSGNEKPNFQRVSKTSQPTVLIWLIAKIQNQNFSTVNLIGNNSQSRITYFFPLILVKEFQGWRCIRLVGFCLHFMKLNAFFKYIE